MIKRIEQYLFRVQITNWGFPWHITFAGYLTLLIFPLLNLVLPLGQTAFLTWFTVNIIGLVNEGIQKRRGDNPRKDMAGDVFANNVGIVINLALIYYIIKIL